MIDAQVDREIVNDRQRSLTVTFVMERGSRDLEDGKTMALGALDRPGFDRFARALFKQVHHCVTNECA